MKRRIPEVYTVMIARTAKPPRVFEIQPIALWFSGGALVMLLVTAFLLGWLQGQSSTRRTVTQLPCLHNSQLTELNV